MKIKKTLALALMFPLLLTGCGNSEKIEMSNNFRSQVLAGEYENAMQYTILADYDYISPTRFGEVLDKTNWITYFKSFSEYKKADYSEDLFLLQLTDDTGNSRTFQLDSQNRFDFEDWYLTDVDINVPVGDQLFLDGVLLGDEYILSTTNGITTYELPVVLNTEMTFKTINSLLGEVEETFEATDGIIDMTMINEESLQILLECLEVKINKLYSCVKNNLTAEDILAELPTLSDVDSANDLLKRIKSNQRIDDPYIGYTSIYAKCSYSSSPRFIDENTISVPLKMEISFNMGNKPTTQIITTDINIDYNSSHGSTVNFTKDTDLKFLYGLVYTEGE